jgi:hypothetical protein
MINQAAYWEEALTSIRPSLVRRHDDESAIGRPEEEDCACMMVYAAVEKRCDD